MHEIIIEGTFKRTIAVRLHRLEDALKMAAKHSAKLSSGITVKDLEEMEAEFEVTEISTKGLAYPDYDKRTKAARDRRERAILTDPDLKQIKAARKVAFAKGVRYVKPKKKRKPTSMKSIRKIDRYSNAHGKTRAKKAGKPGPKPGSKLGYKRRSPGAAPVEVPPAGRGADVKDL